MIRIDTVQGRDPTLDLLHRLKHVIEGLWDNSHFGERSVLLVETDQQIDQTRLIEVPTQQSRKL